MEEEDFNQSSMVVVDFNQSLMEVVNVNQSGKYFKETCVSRILTD